MSNANDFVIENGVLLKYTGTGKEVAIPEGIVAIGKEAFRRKGVARVIMPDTVTEIGWDAFSNCTDLEEVTFSRNLKVICPNAFCNCQSLSRVILHEALERIDACAFSGCVNLKQLTLPEHSVEIGNSAFGSCSSLTDDAGFSIVQGILYYYNCKDPQKMHVPDGTKHIISSVGWNLSGIRSISLPASVEMIDDKTFQSLGPLDECLIGFSVSDPKEAQRLIKKVFSWEALAWAHLQGSLQADPLIMDEVKKQIGSKSGRASLLKKLVSRKDAAPMSQFLSCIKKLPLEELDNAINDAEQPAVRAILMEYKQQYYCPKDAQKEASSRIDKALGSKEKTLADWRKEFKLTKKGDRYLITGYKGEASEVTVPARISGVGVDMGDRVFQDNAVVSMITIEEGVEKIGAYAFTSCKKLQHVYIPASVVDFGKYDAAFYLYPGQAPFTVHAPVGSKAEEQAKERDLPCVAE